MNWRGSSMFFPLWPQPPNCRVQGRLPRTGWLGIILISSSWRSLATITSSDGVGQEAACHEFGRTIFTVFQATRPLVKLKMLWDEDVRTAWWREQQVNKIRDLYKLIYLPQYFQLMICTLKWRHSHLSSQSEFLNYQHLWTMLCCQPREELE